VQPFRLGWDAERQPEIIQGTFHCQNNDDQRDLYPQHDVEVGKDTIDSVANSFCQRVGDHGDRPLQSLQILGVELILFPSRCQFIYSKFLS
jgi:hypothetical protein